MKILHLDPLRRMQFPLIVLLDDVTWSINCIERQPKQIVIETFYLLFLLIVIDLLFTSLNFISFLHLLLFIIIRLDVFLDSRAKLEQRDQ